MNKPQRILIGVASVVILLLVLGFVVRPLYYRAKDQFSQETSSVEIPTEEILVQPLEGSRNLTRGIPQIYLSQIPDGLITEPKLTTILQDKINAAAITSEAELETALTDVTDVYTNNDFTNNSTNWNTAYSWGNHSIAGYFDGTTEAELEAVLSDVTNVYTDNDFTNNSTNWNTAYTHSQSNAQEHTDYFVNTGDETAGTGTEFVWTFNSGIIDPIITFGNNSVEWENTSTFTIDGSEVRRGTVDISSETNLIAGDGLTLTLDELDFDGGASPSGDLGGTWSSPSVTDDSHNHTGTTLSGIDISDDTNLIDGTNITLTNDTLNIDDAFVTKTGGDSMAPKLTITASVTTAPLAIAMQTDAPTSPATGDLYLAEPADCSGSTACWQRYNGASWDEIGPAGGGAPSDATYITQTADATLSAEQALGALATGIVKNTTTTGVLSIATAGTDYYSTDAHVDHDQTTNFASNEHFTQANITATGTIASGVWNGTTIAIANGGTGQTTAQAAIDALTAVSGATNEHVLTKDTGTGNATWKAAAGGGGVSIGDAVGSGTAGSVLFVDGSTNLGQDNANFYWDVAGAKLGLGTTGPDRLLDILDATNPQLRLTHTDGSIYADFQTDSNGDLFVNNTGDQMFLGTNAGGTAQSGATQNIGVGDSVLDALTSGDYNIGIGWSALSTVTTGSGNTCIGRASCFSILSGSDNFGLGFNALYANSTSSRNIAIGANTFAALTGGSNIGIGALVGGAATTLTQTVIIGDGAGTGWVGNKEGVAIGYNSMDKHTGNDNTIIGSQSAKGGGGAGTIIGNTFVGRYTGGLIQTASDYNTFIGHNTGYTITTGADYNILIGADILLQNVTGSNQMSIGNLLFSEGIDNTGTTVSTGNLGIATTSPDRKLDVLDASNPQLRLTHTDGSKYADFQVDTNHDLLIKPSSTGAFIVQPTTDQTDSVQVLASDNSVVLNVDTVDERVGIGTANFYTDSANDLRIAPTGDSVFIGLDAGGAGVTGRENVGIGCSVLDAISNASRNVAIGDASLGALTSGSDNVAIGQDALKTVRTGDGNVGIGSDAGEFNTGSGNVFIGWRTTDQSSSFSDTILIGYNMDAQSTTADGQMSIGNLLFSEGIDGTGTSVSSGNLGIGVVDPDTKLDVNGAITARELAADPSDPDEGSHVCWQSDGTGSGDDGDILCKITAGATTKTITLIDFSAF